MRIAHYGKKGPSPFSSFALRDWHRLCLCLSSSFWRLPESVSITGIQPSKTRQVSALMPVSIPSANLSFASENGDFPTGFPSPPCLIHPIPTRCAICHGSHHPYVITQDDMDTGSYVACVVGGGFQPSGRSPAPWKALPSSRLASTPSS